MSRLRLQLSSLARGTQTVDLFHLSYGYNEGDRAHLGRVRRKDTKEKHSLPTLSLVFGGGWGREQ